MPIPLCADLINRQNIRVIQSRGSARLALETAQLHLVCRQPLWEKLERDFAPQPLVSRQIHFAHSADANERLDSVMTDQFSHHRAGALISQEFGSNFESR